MNLQTLIDNGVLNQCKFAEVTQIVLYYKDKEEYWNYFTNILFSSSFESSENRKFLTDKPYSINSKIKVIISREVISKENVYEILKNAENMQEWKWKDDVARLDSVFPIDSQFIPETDPTGCVTSDSSIVPIEMSLYGSNFFGGYYCCELFSAKKYLSNELSAKNIVAKILRYTDKT